MPGIRNQLAIALVALILGAAAGGSILVALLPGEAPASLAASRSLATVEPSTLQFDDPRDVSVVLSLDTGSGIRSSRGGTLTSLTCTAGQAVVSGSSAFGVDGTAVISLSTAVPLWRNIAVGDDGPDVGALETELARLGAALAPDAEWDWDDARAFDALLGPVTTDDNGTVQLASLAWLPAPEVTIASCPVALGASLGSGELVATFQPRISLARFVPPAGAVEGERALVLDDTVIAAPADGVIVDRSALEALASSSAFAERDPADNPPALSASAVLANLVRVSVLPPSAVYGLSGESGCVHDERGVVVVTVIASQLGRTLVVPERPLRAVLVHPDAGSACPR